MPTKKGDKKIKNKKTTKRKTTKKKPVKKKNKKKQSVETQNAKVEIKEAANKIPGLILEQAGFKSTPETTPDTSVTPPPTISKRSYSKRPYYNDSGERSKRTLLWFGVIILTVIVLFMWIWNTSTFMKDINLHKQSKNNLWEQTKEDWQKMKKEETNNNLAKILPVTTSTASSTSELTVLPATTNTSKLKTTIKQTLLNLIASSTTTNVSSTTSTLK